MTFVQRPMNIFTLSSLSISDNALTNYGKDMSAVLKIAEVLPQTCLTSLE